MNEQNTTSAEEISIFEIADWLWSFRWLALTLMFFAAAWSSALIWSGSDSSPAAATYRVTSTIFPSGTHIRSASDIASILKERLNSVGVRVETTEGANPVIAAATSSQDAQLAIATAQELEEQLAADVQAQIDLLSRLIQDDNASEFVSSQYVINVSLLDGIRGGLIKIIASSSEEVPPQTSGPARGGRFLLPWALCFGAFIALALGITFAKQWRSHREQKRHCAH